MSRSIFYDNFSYGTIALKVMKLSALVSALLL